MGEVMVGCVVVFRSTHLLQVIVRRTSDSKLQTTGHIRFCERGGREEEREGGQEGEKEGGGGEEGRRGRGEGGRRREERSGGREGEGREMIDG